MKIESDGLLRVPYFFETKDTQEAICCECVAQVTFGEIKPPPIWLVPRYATETSRLCVRCLSTIGPINPAEAEGR